MNRRAFLAGAAGTAAVLREDWAARLHAITQSGAGRPADDLARDENVWLQVRHAFTIDRNHVNLNSGSVSPAPRPVQQAVSDDHACGLGAMAIDGIDAEALTAFLERAYRIHVRPRFVDGEFSCIRVAPNVFTTLEEVDLFAAAIERAATRGLA